MDDAERLDVAVVGGGPSGLAAALWLGRYRRRVRVFEGGAPRNAPTRAVHGYPGLPDLTPEEMRERLRAQAEKAGAEYVEACVTAIEGEKDAFRVVTDRTPPLDARRVLLAYGRHDVLPDIPGLTEAYGHFVFHCPDCDGPEMTGLRVGVIGHDTEAARLALALLNWAGTATLLAHGAAPDLDEPARRVLERYGVAVRPERIVRIDCSGGTAARLELEGGAPLALDGVFFHHGTRPADDLAERLGCDRDALGHVQVDRTRETSVDGVYAAGDLVGLPYLVINAAAEGVHAALGLHRSLMPPACAL